MEISKEQASSTERYKYYGKAGFTKDSVQETVAHAIQLGKERLNPSLTNPDFLVYRERKKQFTRWLGGVSAERLRVLDVGGRIQPYRPLVEDRLEQYVAIDPQMEGLLDVVAAGEGIPFSENTFDIVFCTQVLGYVSDPSKVINEMHRVLLPGGVLILSAPALFPQHHDERWRFLREGYSVLMKPFSVIEVVPEGYSVAGFIRTLNICVGFVAGSAFLYKIVSHSIIPVLNIFGLVLDVLSFKSERLTTNYSVLALK